MRRKFLRLLMIVVLVPLATEALRVAADQAGTWSGTVTIVPDLTPLPTPAPTPTPSPVKLNHGAGWQQLAVSPDGQRIYSSYRPYGEEPLDMAPSTATPKVPIRCCASGKRATEVRFTTFHPTSKTSASRFPRTALCSWPFPKRIRPLSSQFSTSKSSPPFTTLELAPNCGRYPVMATVCSHRHNAICGFYGSSARATISSSSKSKCATQKQDGCALTSRSLGGLATAPRLMCDGATAMLSLCCKVSGVPTCGASRNGV